MTGSRAADRAIMARITALEWKDPGIGPPIRPGWPDLTLVGLLKDVLARINSGLPPEAPEEVFRKVLHPRPPRLIENNRRFHLQLTLG